MTYAEWIAAYEADHEHLRGLCSSATAAMIEAFPELKRVAGWTNNAEHFWCVAPDGSIVDPTAKQFDDAYPNGVILTYRAWKPGDLTRVGKCMNCGEEIFERVMELGGDRKSICSDDCHQEYVNYLRREA